jgi:hypothetical protein
MFEPCACLGPKPGEPYCMCSMINHGLKTKKDYEMSPEAKQKMEDAFSEIFSRRRQSKQEKV